MQRIFLFLLCLSTSLQAFAANMLMNLSDAIKVHMVQAEAVTTGQSYKARALRLKLINKSGSVIQLKINQGVIFAPENPDYQPLVCAGDETITLQPFKEGQLDVQTFCADAGKTSPGKDLKYTYARVGSDTLVKALHYIKKNVLFDALGQKGVWVITNGYLLETVYENGRDMQSNKLVEYLAMITGRPKPGYYVSTAINETAGQPVYVPKPLKIYAKFEQVLDAPKKLSLGVFDQDGKQVQEVFTNRQFGKAGHRYTVEFESSNVPAGKYYIRLKEGESVLQEKMVEVR